MTTKGFGLYKVLQWESQVSTSSCEWENSRSVQQKTFGAEQNVSAIEIPTMSQDMHEQLKLANMIVDLVDRSDRKNKSVTMLRYNAERLESSYDQVWLLTRKKEDKKFQGIVYAKFKDEDFIYLLDVLSSVFNKVSTSKTICKAPEKVIATVYSSSLFAMFEPGWVGLLEMKETYFPS